MIRRLRLDWTGRSPSTSSGRPVRLLAVSDDRSAELDDERNRAALGPIDAVIGSGDLEPDYLDYLAGTYGVPLIYVRGNHDRGGAWRAGAENLPEPLENATAEVAGLRILGLSWPGRAEGRAVRDDSAAWWQAVKAVSRTTFVGERPDIVVSHVPPEGLGDAPADPYHRGFDAYHWLCRRLRPQLWLHGHTTTPAAADWRTTWDSTTLVNATGGVLIELAEVAGGRGANIGRP